MQFTETSGPGTQSRSKSPSKVLEEYRAKREQEMKKILKSPKSVSKFTNYIEKITKGCLFLFNYFIDMRPTLMSPFFVEKTRKKTCFFDKKWTH